jgi:hypothetical protein
MICRVAAQAAAPLLLGLAADHLGGSEVEGLRFGFLLLLPLLACGGFMLALAGHAYPAEVAAVQASTVSVTDE